MCSMPDQRDEIIDRERRLATYRGDDEVVDSDTLRKEIASQGKPVFSFATGLAGLDVSIGNLESGELLAIGGPAKNGKTLLAQTITVNLSKSGNHCLWFTFEVPTRQFLSQMPESTSFYLPKKLTPGKMDWLADRILESKLKFDSRIVFIDNLHHLVDFVTVRNMSLDIGVIIRSLKRMAIDLNVVIIVLCHSRKPDIVKGEIQQVSEWDLRDSSFIPQETDSTIMVQRKVDSETKELSNRAIVKVCLHRRTGVVGKIIHVIKAGRLLEEDGEYA